MNKVAEKISGSNKRRQRYRRATGSSAIELSVAALIMIAIVAFALNICIALIGYTLNDRACRDACRSAAQGANATEARQRATQILKSYQKSDPFFRNLTVDSVTYTDFAGSPPAGISPFVTVITSAKSDVPCPLAIFGKDVFGSSLQFRKSYTFPIVRLTVKV